VVWMDGLMRGGEFAEGKGTVKERRGGVGGRCAFLV
jgi:hypothetical protein